MKRKITLIILSILLIGFIGSTIHYRSEKNLVGDSKEREKILECTMWKLIEQGYKKDDVEEIRVFHDTKGGNLPYKVAVVFKKDKSTGILYMWKDNTQKEIEISGSTGSGWDE